jgi:arylsulfatase B
MRSELLWMHLRRTLSAGVAGAALLLAGAAGAQNIVLIIADDVGVDGIAAYGEQPAAGPTPNIDSLAAQGVLFRNAWANPTCSPTRASILTGLHPVHHGVGWPISPDDPELETGLDPAHTTLPDLLGPAGYRNVALGKYHIGGLPMEWEHPLQVGFDYYAGHIWSGTDYFSWPKTVNGTQPDGTPVVATTFTSTTYNTTDTFDDAIAELDLNEPYFLWVSPMAVHTPLHEPPASLHSFDLTGLPIAGNEPTYHKAMLEAMDTELGRLLAGIDFSDTTVIFIGDNGTPDLSTEPPFIPSHGKFSLFEGGVNVPLIVAGQAVPPAAQGQESAALVQSTDLFDTILEIAGVVGSAPDSESIVPYLSNPALPSIRSWVFAERFRPNGGPVDPERHYRAARDERYKIQRLSTDPDVFYDLLTDPWELSPLNVGSLTPEQQASYNTLSAVLDALAPPESPPIPALGGPALAVAAGSLCLAALLAGRRRRPGRGD